MNRCTNQEDSTGDCKAIVKEYLACVKRSRGSNDQCRHLARQFLECRMEHGLMARDEFANLGFVDADPKS